MTITFAGSLAKLGTSVVGRSVRRTDALEKLTGAAKFVADIVTQELLFGKIKRSDVAHARIKRIDPSRALALPGVRAALTYADVPRILHSGSPHPRSASVTKDQYILDEHVRYWGEGVAAVAAMTEEIAEEALELIEVEYEPLPAVLTIEEAMAPGAPKIHEDGRPGNDVLPPVVVRRGDVEKGFAEADVVLEGEFELGRPTAAYMEPNVCLCQWDGNGKLTIHTSTQSAFMVRGTLAEVLGMPLNKVRVLVDHMGGGFGAKQDIFQHEFLCALLARATGRPVRIEYTRKETFLGGRSRHSGRIWLKQGFRKDGAIVARQARIHFNSGAYGSHGPGVTNVSAASLTSLYRCENVDVVARCLYTNTPIAGAFRGYGVVQSYYALDLQVDEAAERLGFDPAEFRLMNAVCGGDISPSGHPIVGHGLEDCIRRGIEESDWRRVRSSPKVAKGAKWRGWGIGCEMHGSSAYPGIKEQGNALVKLNEDGSVTLMTGAGGLGTGAHTALAQIAAEALGVSFDTVSVVHGDTDIVPWDIGAFASHTTYMVGTATKMAAESALRQILERAAPLFGATPDRLRLEEGVLRCEGSNRSLTLAEACGPKLGLPAAQIIGVGTYSPTKSYSFAAHFTEVEVDVETGEVRVIQVIPVHEIGKVVHPIAAQGQIEGGIQQGIGHTLTEDYQIDEKTGRSFNPSFVDYKMPLAMDMPPIRTILLETAPDPGGPYGAKGVGEDPIIAIGPSIANALYDAIGVRFRRYPITPEHVLDELRRKVSGKA
jgi:xanthine dehydrogenase molybdenum-binding subunit